MQAGPPAPPRRRRHRARPPLPVPARRAVRARHRRRSPRSSRWPSAASRPRRPSRSGRRGGRLRRRRARPDRRARRPASTTSPAASSSSLVTGGPLEVAGLPLDIVAAAVGRAGRRLFKVDGKGVLYRLCGLGKKCAIDAGQAVGRARPAAAPRGPRAGALHVPLHRRRERRDVHPAAARQEADGRRCSSAAPTSRPSSPGRWTRRSRGPRRCPAGWSSRPTPSWWRRSPPSGSSRSASRSPTGTRARSSCSSQPG